MINDPFGSKSRRFSTLKQVLLFYDKDGCNIKGEVNNTLE